MRRQIKLFFTALMFYTRIPCPKQLEYSQDNINHATRYFPLIGWIVGALSYIAYSISSSIFTIEIAVLISLIVGVLLTGAFHEDGFADVFDGFGGGWTKEKILEIMKDSRIGVYGTISLIFLFAIKYLALIEIANNIHGLHLALIFILYHSLARFTSIQLVFFSQYSRDDESSKVKPIAKAHGYKEKIGVYLFGGIPFLSLCYINWELGYILLILFLIVYSSKKYFEKWIGGYTGDCLGAIEQFAECIILLYIVAIW
ncbi:MAG: adenosylcobinamide-GDP ribazoletransferase [Chitinophagales bacterium]|nr:adenosylcobinamide-GDP ribazoletransferase [Chitinophagales bacterium]